MPIAHILIQINDPSRDVCTSARAQAKIVGQKSRTQESRIEGEMLAAQCN